MINMGPPDAKVPCTMDGWGLCSPLLRPSGALSDTRPSTGVLACLRCLRQLAEPPAAPAPAHLHKVSHRLGVVVAVVADHTVPEPLPPAACANKGPASGGRSASVTGLWSVPRQQAAWLRAMPSGESSTGQRPDPASSFLLNRPGRHSGEASACHQLGAYPSLRVNGQTWPVRTMMP